MKRYTEKAHINGQMAENLLEIGKITKCKINYLNN